MPSETCSAKGNAKREDNAAAESDQTAEEQGEEQGGEVIGMGPTNCDVDLAAMAEEAKKEVVDASQREVL